MRLRRNNIPFAAILSGLVILGNVTACDHGPWDDDDESHHSTDYVVITPPSDGSNSSSKPAVTECKAVSGSTYWINDDVVRSDTRYYCYELDDRRYTTTCKSGECSEVKAYVHYGLGEDLGEGYTVHLEAFDNPTFSGYPAGSVEINNFKAEKGYWKDTEILLPEGDYYLRAFLSNNESPNIPYQLGDMVLIRDQPVGVFGVISSGPEKVHVDYKRRYTDPVTIHLNQMLKKPGSEPDTNARLRTIIKFPDGFELAAGKEVKVEIHKSTDFEASPVASMTIRSELFMIQGQSGKAEVVSESLEPGKYFVRAYYDSDHNGFFDEGELHAVHGSKERPLEVLAEKDHTRSLTLSLTAE